MGPPYPQLALCLNSVWADVSIGSKLAPIQSRVN
ncbi:hypothetical protein MCBRY_003769 [Methylocystis bryophila]